MGPTNYLGLPEHSKGIIMAGMVILGMIQAMIVLPVLPEVIDEVTLKYKLVNGVDPEADGKIHDTICSSYALFYQTSSLLSPIIGSSLFDTVDYRNTMSICMFVMFFVGTIYMIFNCGISVFSK